VQTGGQQANTLARPASIKVMQPTFNRRNTGRYRGGVLERRWRNGQRGGLLNRKTQFDSGATRASHAPLE
jgi:hypothetical protein